MKKLKLYEEFINDFNDKEDAKVKTIGSSKDRYGDFEQPELYKDVKQMDKKYITLASGVIQVPGWNMY